LLFGALVVGPGEELEKKLEHFRHRHRRCRERVSRDAETIATAMAIAGHDPQAVLLIDEHLRDSDGGEKWLGQNLADISAGLRVIGFRADHTAAPASDQPEAENPNELDGEGDDLAPLEKAL